MHPIAPLFHTLDPNSPIIFDSIRVSSASISPDPKTTVTARAELKFLPNKLLEFVIPSTDDTAARKILGVFGPYKCKINVPELGGTFEATRARQMQDASIYIPSRLPVQLFAESDRIKQATFHLFNWPKFICRDDYVLENQSSIRRCGRVVLKFDDWKLTIAEHEQTERLIELLDSTGGYAITHIGYIERSSGAMFSSLELNEVFEAMTTFFSFMLGRWSSPRLLVGQNQTNETVYQHCGLGQVASGSWFAGHSNLDIHHFEQMSDTAQGFWNRWKDPIWKKPLSHVINWYVNANHTSGGVGVDTGLLFKQSAFELLAWTYCVLDRRMVSPDAFEQRGLTASNKFRLLASSMSIPTVVPEQLNRLKRNTATNKSWYDAMEAITKLRNGLVHPGSTKHSVDDATYHDAWNFSLWFISLAILRLFNY